MNFTCAIVFALALLLAQSSAVPATRRSSSATETGSSRSRTSGSSSGSGDGCDRELTEEERTTLISNIRSTIDGLESTLNGVNVWVALVSSLFSLEDMIFISVICYRAPLLEYTNMVILESMVVAATAHQLCPQTMDMPSPRASPSSRCL